MSKLQTDERLRNFVKEALNADVAVERTGEMYRAEEVHAWLEHLAAGQKTPTQAVATIA